MVAHEYRPTWNQRPREATLLLPFGTVRASIIEGGCKPGQKESGSLSLETLVSVKAVFSMDEFARSQDGSIRLSVHTHRVPC